jgi:hypothetical protein
MRNTFLAITQVSPNSLACLAPAAGQGHDNQSHGSEALETNFSEDAHIPVSHHPRIACKAFPVNIPSVWSLLKDQCIMERVTKLIATPKTMVGLSSVVT